MGKAEIPSSLSEKELGNNEALCGIRHYKVSSPLFTFLLFVKSAFLDVAGIHMQLSLHFRKGVVKAEGRA